MFRKSIELGDYFFKDTPGRTIISKIIERKKENQLKVGIEEKEMRSRRQKEYITEKKKKMLVVKSTFVKFAINAKIIISSKTLPLLHTFLYEGEKAFNYHTLCLYCTLVHRN